MLLAWVVAACLASRGWAASTRMAPAEVWCFNETLWGYSKNIEFTFRYHIDKSSGDEGVIATIQSPGSAENTYMYEASGPYGHFATLLNEDGQYKFCFTNTNAGKIDLFWMHHEDVRTWRQAQHPAMVATHVGPNMAMLNTQPDTVVVKKDNEQMALFRFDMTWMDEETALTLKRTSARAFIRIFLKSGSEKKPFEVQWYPDEKDMDSHFKTWGWDYNEIRWDTKPKNPTVISRQRTNKDAKSFDVRFTVQLRAVLAAYFDDSVPNHDQIIIALTTTSDDPLEFYGLADDYQVHPQLIVETDHGPAEGEVAKLHRTIFGLQSTMKQSAHEERFMRDTTETTFTKALWFKIAFFVATVVVYIAKMIYTKGLFKQA